MATTITANGINFPDGSASAPSIGGTDTNTGLFTGSDIVGFATGGIERLRIKADGKIEIPTTGKLSLGMSSPVAQFTVGTANGSRVIEIQGTDGVIRGFDRNSSAWAQIDFEAASYSFDTGGSERLRITSTGAIQNYYNSSLPVTDSRPILQLGYSAIGDDVSGYNAVTCNAYPVNGNSTWHYIGSSSLGASRYHIGFGDHKWFTAAAGTRGNDITWSEKVRLDSTGRLLVNQNTHQGSTSKLEVTGTLNNSYPGYSFPLMVSDDAAYNSSAGPGGGIGFSFKQNTGGQYAQAGGIRGIKENTTDGNYASALAFYTRPNGAGTAEKLRLDSSGDLQFRNNTSSHQGLKWYSHTGHLGLSFTYGEGNANPTLNIFRWDSQSGFPYGNLIINTGHSSSPTQALKLRTDKHIELAGSLIMANGNGIDFSATSDASGKTSELLDDYEEGTFTPTLVGFSSISYTARSGRYTKIGNLVNFQIYLLIASATGSAAHCMIGSLPFTSSNTGNSNGGAYKFYDNGFMENSGNYSTKVDASWYIPTNNTNVQAYKNSNGSGIYGNDTSLGNGATNKYLLVQGSYVVD